MTTNHTVSFLENSWDKNPKELSMHQVYKIITGNRLKNETEKYRKLRSQELVKEAELIKKASAGIVPSALCRGGRAKKNAVCHTGIGMADFDGIPAEALEALMDKLRLDPYVYLAYITISHSGLRVLYLTDTTDAAHHPALFDQGNTYFANLLGYHPDPSCKDLTRLSYLCYCPSAIFNPHPAPMHIQLPESAEKRKVGRPKKIHHAPVELAAQEVCRQLEKAGKAYIPGHRNEYLSSALYLMNRFGVSAQEATQWAHKQFADFEQPALESIVKSVYQKTEEHGSKKLPSAKQSAYHYASMEELEEFIHSQAYIRHNVITERREIKLDKENLFRDITDKDENSLWVRAQKAGVHGTPKVFQMILNSEFVPDYNPFTEYFHALPQWDGHTDHIHTLASSVHTTTPEVFASCFKKWFVGMIASILNPKVVNHEILVFIGEQGKYKTTWLNRLLPPSLERYFYTKTNSNRMTKDDQFTLAEFALICFEEIDSMHASELNQLKAMITMPTINERAAYARNKTHRPHIASFCGTGNNLRFLTDPTGNRRWLPFEVTDIDDPYVHTPDYDRVYAQALALYRSGFRYWFTQDEIVTLNCHNEAFETPDLEKELILMYYRKPRPGEAGAFVSTAGILQRINAMIKKPLSAIRIGIVMKKLGFDTCRAIGVRGYRVVEILPEEAVLLKKLAHENQTQEKLPF